MDRGSMDPRTLYQLRRQGLPHWEYDPVTRVNDSTAAVSFVLTRTQGRPVTFKVKTAKGLIGHKGGLLC